MKRRSALIALGTGFHLQATHALDPLVIADVDPKKLPGSWTCKIGIHLLAVTFSDSGLFKGSIITNGKLVDEFEGSWKLESSYIGNTAILWKFAKSRTIQIGTLDRDEIEILNDDLLVLWTKNRVRRAYQRVKIKK